MGIEPEEVLVPIHQKAAPPTPPREENVVATATTPPRTRPRMGISSCPLFLVRAIVALSILAAFFLPEGYWNDIFHATLDQTKVKATTTSNNAPQPTLDIIETKQVTILCQLSGEMGNNLGKLGHCLSLKWWLEGGTFYNSTLRRGYHARIALRHQDHNKWVKGAADLRRCFPNTKHYDFGEGNTDEFVRIFNQQNEVFGVTGRWPQYGVNPFSGINDVSEDPMVRQKARTEAMHRLVEKVGTNHAIIPTTNDKNITIPFLFADHIQTLDRFVDQYYDELRHYYRFDNSCCKLQPDPDESVFHFRNFKGEMPRRWNSYGFVEADPQQTAASLFGHLTVGEKVAIITRFGSDAVQPYVEALQLKGLKVRVIEGQDGPADFCFLMSARKEIVGVAYSTYLIWAGYLGNATRVVAYSTTGRKGHKFINYTHPVLRDRFDFPLVRPMR